MVAERIKTNSPDVYHDTREVIWKNVVADGYRNTATVLKRSNLLTDPIVYELHVRFIDAFNSNHDKATFDEKFATIIESLFKRLQSLGRHDEVREIRAHIRSTKKSTIHSLRSIKHLDTQNGYEQSVVHDGHIDIAGKSIEQFSKAPNYFRATLSLVDINQKKLVHLAEESYWEGTSLSSEERGIVEQAKEEDWEMADLITQILLKEQIDKRYESLQVHETRPLANEELGSNNLKESTRQAYYLMGKLMAVIALRARTKESNSAEKKYSDPIEWFLAVSGHNVGVKQIRAIKQIALAHCSHGLNSGELTAQLAGSVRTTFPRALIASINIRSGVLHAGAIQQCMKQTEVFLNSNISPEDFVANLQRRKEKIYGFGHRIHKTSEDDLSDMLGKDPRTELYVQATLAGFPEQKELVHRLISYIKAVRSMRPSLGANTDFGAAVLFHALKLPPKVAEGFFTAFRIPGLCAQVINELSVKGNSRRPPFAQVLSYKSL